MMDRLEHWAARAPDRLLVAQRAADGTWIGLTYGEMLERVQRIAAGLLERDLSRDRPLAILSGNSVEHLLLAFAATWAGIPYCAVSPAYSQASSDLGKLRFVFELLTPGVVAAFDTRAYEKALTRVVPEHLEIIGDADTVVGGHAVKPLGALDRAPSPAVAAAHARTGPDSIVKFLLTSGSTGEPKAVVTTERMLTSNQAMLHQSMPFLVDEPPALVDWLPWNHTFGGSHNVGLVLFNGGTLYIDAGRPTAGAIAETVRNLREISPTVYFNVPKGFEALAPHLARDAVLRRSFYRRLRAYFFAGASLSQHVWDALDQASLAERGSKIPMLSGLGATETGPSVTFTTPAVGRAGVIGLPAAGNIVKLAPVEDKLEIRVRGPNVTPGYWRRPTLTAAAFDEEGFYRLGDAVRLNDALDPTRGLSFDGRIAEDFKLASGTWVSVGPLRTTLIAALAPIAQDVVIAGLDRDTLAALIIPDLAGCAQMLQSASAPSYAEIASHGTVREHIRAALQAHARRYPGSSMKIVSAMLLPSPPSLDHGEITDKGSINQRAVLAHRVSCVALMYAAEPSPAVIRIEMTID
jgi:feruloyl-CoA synthase